MADHPLISGFWFIASVNVFAVALIYHLAYSKQVERVRLALHLKSRAAVTAEKDSL